MRKPPKSPLADLRDSGHAPLLRRPRRTDPLRGLSDPGGRVRDCARADPQDLLRAVHDLARIAAALPCGALPTAQRGPLRRHELPALPDLLKELAAALETARDLGLPTFGPSPADLRAQATRIERYRRIGARAALALHGALDLRQLFGGLMYHLLDAISSNLLRWLADPEQRADKSRLEIAFSTLLLHKEQVLQALARRRAESAAERAAAQAQIAEREAALEAEDVATTLALGLPVPREALERAALRHAAGR